MPVDDRRREPPIAKAAAPSTAAQATVAVPMETSGPRNDRARCADEELAVKDPSRGERDDARSTGVVSSHSSARVAPPNDMARLDVAEDEAGGPSPNRIVDIVAGPRGGYGSSGNAHGKIFHRKTDRSSR